MSLYNLAFAVGVNTLASIGIAMFWYSNKGFGNLFVTSHYGSQKNYETTRRRHKEETTWLMCVLCPLIYNLLLIFLINNVYAPKTLNDLFGMVAVILMIHVLLEVPHISYENRSYTAFFVHTMYHALQTIVPILILKNFFNMPKLANMRV